MTVITGWVLAVVAFFVAGGLSSGIAGPGGGLFVGGAAALWVWKYFDDKYKAELAALLSPPAEVWPLPMPAAWTCIKNVLAVAHVETGVSGVSNWHIQQEDTTTGTIQAQLNFQQALGSPTQPNILRRSITLNARLTPEGDGTKVEFSYQIFSPSGTGLVESVIKTTQASMTYEVNMIKGAQGNV